MTGTQFVRLAAVIAIVLGGTLILVSPSPPFTVLGVAGVIFGSFAFVEAEEFS